MTVTRSYNAGFFSNKIKEYLIGIHGVGIRNDRHEYDIALFDSRFWSGILAGSDGYPTQN